MTLWGLQETEYNGYNSYNQTTYYHTSISYMVFTCQKKYIPVSEEDISKTTVITLFDLFKFLMMPFSLQNAVQTFQWFNYIVFNFQLYILGFGLYLL